VIIRQINLFIASPYRQEQSACNAKMGPEFFAQDAGWRMPDGS
jgi:hypothetical protein